MEVKTIIGCVEFKYYAEIKEEDQRDARSWCLDHCTRTFSAGLYGFYFVEEKDYVLFVLRWT